MPDPRPRTPSCSSRARRSWPSVRPTSTNSPAASPACGWSWCQSQAMWCRHRLSSRGAGAQARVRRHVPHVRRRHRAADVARRRPTNMNTFGGQAGSAHVAAQEDEVRTHSNAEMTYHGGRFDSPGRGAGGHGARAGQALPVLGPDADLAVDGELRLPLHDDAPQQQEGQAIGRRIVAAGHRATDPGPGVENWLDTGGRLEGYMLVRWVLADGPPHPTAECGQGLVACSATHVGAGAVRSGGSAPPGPASRSRRGH